MMQSRYKASRMVAWQEINGTILVVGNVSMPTMTLEETGVEIWNLLIRECLSVQEVIDRLSHKYSASNLDEIAKDVIDFIRMLKEKEIIERLS